MKKIFFLLFLTAVCTAFLLNRQSFLNFLQSREVSFIKQIHPNAVAGKIHDVKPIVIRYPAIPNSKQISDLPERIDGDNRFMVAANISKKWVHADTVVLANYVAFADALTAAPLAYKLNAPILLTNPNYLPPETKQQIQSLGVKNAIIVGGEASISPLVVSQLNGLGITNVKRISGKNRYEVSMNIARSLGFKGTAVFANGSSFADALAIAPYAAINSYPIVLTSDNQIPADILPVLKKAAIHKSIVIGGAGSINQTLFNELQNPVRIDGRDRYEVASNVAKIFGEGRSKTFLATGKTFADALTGSVLAAKENGVILLTKSDQLPAPAFDVIQQKQVPLTILGGTSSVSDNIVLRLTETEKTSRPVLYIVPHQDDEVLTYGIDIRNELSRGRNVQVILLTKGDDSKSRDILNGKLYCSIHKKFHNPVKEGYKDGVLSPEQFSEARTNEYYRASEALGVPLSNIHTEFIPDGKYYSTAIQAVIEKYLAKYPNADVRSFSWFDEHPAHALIGKTILKMQSEGEIERYQAKFLVSINTDRFYKVRKPMKVMMNRLQNPADFTFLKKAVGEYTRFDPKNGFYAIGYHSVRVQFDALLRNPYVNSHY